MEQKKGYKKNIDASKNKLRLGDLIGKMKKILNVADRIESLLEKMSSSLCFCIGNHFSFLEEFERQWELLGLKKYEKSKSRTNIKCSDSDLFNAKQNKDFTEICQSGGPEGTMRWRCTKVEAMLIIGNMVLNREIMSRITQPHQIPASIIRAFSATRIELRTCFPNLEKDNDLLNDHPWWVEHSINVSRYTYHKMRMNLSGGTQTISEMEIEISDASSSISVTSDIEYNMSVSKGWNILLKGEQIVEIFEDNELYKNGLIIHPYTLSASVFCIANYMSRIIKEESGVDYSPTDVYLFMKNWMESGSELHKNTNISKAHKMIIDWTDVMSLYIGNHKNDSNIILKRDFGTLLDLFSNARDIIFMKHRKKDFKYYSHGKFKKYTLVKYSELEHSKSDILNVVYAGNGSITNDELLAMVFNRNEVSELELYTSMNIMNKLFDIKAGKDVYWRVEHTTKESYIVIHPVLYNNIRKHCIPYVPFQLFAFDRNTWCPVYLLHLHNYVYGNELGLLNSIKFMLKQFTKLINDHELMPRVDNPNIYFYRILHLIVNRYGSTETIWRELISPLNSIPYLWTTKKKSEGKRQRKRTKEDETHYIKGLRDGTMSIYSALRSFAFINEKHFVKKTVLEMVRSVFYLSQYLQNKYSMTWALVSYLYDNASTAAEEEEDVEIPLELPSEEFIIPDNEDGTKTQKFPLHMLLYYFCCAPEIEDSLATLLFRSIGIKLRKHNDHGTSYPGMVFCARRFGVEEAEKNKYMFMDTERDFYAEYKDIEGNSSNISNMGGLSFLFKSLEELSLYPIQVDLDIVCYNDDTLKNRKRKRSEEGGELYRGFAKGTKDFLNIHPFHVLSSENSPIDKIPVDFRNGDPMTISNSFPIWNVELYESDSQSGMDMRFAIDVDARDQEFRPFFDSSDILSCIIINPIMRVKIPPQSEKRERGIGRLDRRLNRIRPIFDLLVEIMADKYTIEELVQLTTSFHCIYDHYKKSNGKQSHMLVNCPIANRELEKIKITFIGLIETNDKNYTLEQLIRYSILKEAPR